MDTVTPSTRGALDTPTEVPDGRVQVNKAGSSPNEPSEYRGYRQCGPGSSAAATQQWYRQTKTFQLHSLNGGIIGIQDHKTAQ